MDVPADSGLPAYLLVLLPLIGTIVGGSITAYVSYIVAKLNRKTAVEVETKRHSNVTELEKTRAERDAQQRLENQRREDARRWDQRLQEVSARYVGTTYKMILAFDNSRIEIQQIEDSFVVTEPTQNHLQATVNESKMKEAARKQVRDAEAEGVSHLSELLMIAPESVSEDAIDLWTNTTNVISTTSSAVRENAQREYEVQRARLIAVVKSVLHTKEGDGAVVAVRATATAEAKAPADPQ